MPCSKTQHLVLGGAELLTPNLDLEALPFHPAPSSTIIISRDSRILHLHYGRLEAVRFVSRPPLTKLIGGSSLHYHYYAFGRPVNRKICQNAFLCYNNNVFRFIQTTICIYVYWQQWVLSAGLRWHTKKGCSSLISFIRNMHLVGLRAVRLVRTPSLFIIMCCAPLIQHFGCLETVRFVRWPLLIKISGCGYWVYRWYASGMT